MLTAGAAKPRRRRRRKNPVVEVSQHHDAFRGFTVTYQLELVQCGKPKCKKWHGPYWYAYWTEGQRTRSLYIGKTLRPAFDVYLAKRKPIAFSLRADESSTRKRRWTRPTPLATST